MVKRKISIQTEGEVIEATIKEVREIEEGKETFDKYGTIYARLDSGGKWFDGDNAVISIRGVNINDFKIGNKIKIILSKDFDLIILEKTTS